jgi:DNA-binding response OmpR family regulator
METILIIEDDATMLRGLKDNFEFVGFRTVTASDGETGLNAALNERPDLILLDIMLPKINGYEVCRLIRKENLDMPIIMLTAKGQESDIILGLNLGADDYVTKPFSINELLARANAFLRRRRGPANRVLHFADVELDLSARVVRRAGRAVELTPKEFELLAFLAANPGRALTRDHILDRVWGHGVFVTRRSVDRCIKTLRAKLGDPSRLIQTIREVGYRFEGESVENSTTEDTEKGRGHGEKKGERQKRS